MRILHHGGVAVAVVGLSVILGCGSSEPGPEDGGAPRKDRRLSQDSGFDDLGSHDAGGPVVEEIGPPADFDGDGIPDREDPAPEQSNALLFSDQFTSIDPKWLFTSGRIGVDPGSGHLRVPSAEPFVDEGWLGPQPVWADVLIRSSFRVRGPGTSAELGAGRLGLIGRINAITPKRYLMCGLDLNSSEVILTEHDGPSTGGKLLASAPLPSERPEWINVSFTIEGEHLRCRVGEVSITASSNLFFSGSAGIRVFDAEFEADWIEIYDL